MIPIISPPLVGVLGFTFILGRAGHGERAACTTGSIWLEPINFVYGVHGVCW